jgi:hypothetical protein
MIDYKLACAIFIATLPILIPLLAVNVWSLSGRRRADAFEIRKELDAIRERLATLEERDRWTHPQLAK